MSIHRSKFRAIRTEVDGIKFDSKLEASRYQQLKMLDMVGEISGLLIHTRWPLAVAGCVVGHYESDFYYTDVASGKKVIEDVKGVRTPMFLWKKKHFEIQYPYSITEIPARKSKARRT